MTCGVNQIGIYPLSIEAAQEKCYKLLEKYDIDSDIDELVEESFDYIKFEGITNSIIRRYFEITKELIKKKKRKIEITYFVNCKDSHIYIDGEEFFSV